MSSDSSGDDSHGSCESYETYETYTETYSSYSDSSTTGESVPEGVENLRIAKEQLYLEAIQIV